MNTRETILAAALQILEEGGSDQLSTRAVCTAAKVTAPTLYHHFGSADGLLSAAMSSVAEAFLASKRSAVTSDDPATALCEGWDDYVRFAASRPRLYAAVMARILGGATIEAAEEGHAELTRRVRALADQNALMIPADQAIALVWASANAAALLYVSALMRDLAPPSDQIIAALRDTALAALYNPRSDH